MFLLTQYFLRKTLDHYTQEKQRSICLVGLPGAGKTSFYNSIRLALGQKPIPIFPTTGCSFQKFDQGGVTWLLNDLAGRRYDSPPSSD